MATPLQKRAFWMVAGIAVAAEGVVIYQQWPSPPLKICASVELGELLAAATKSETELREARARLRTFAEDGASKEAMRMEAVSAAAWNEVARYKQRAQERQKAGGEAARGGSCT